MFASSNAREPFRPLMDHLETKITQSGPVDMHTPQEVFLGSHLRINLVGLEDTEPRVAPSNSRISCLRPPPPGWGS
jgi:hypothetical protein